MTLLLTPHDLSPSAASRRVSAGTLLRLARGVFCDEVALTPEEAAARHVFELVGRVLPGAVVTGRSAAGPGGPLLEGPDGRRVLVVAHPERARDLMLDGVLVQVLHGPTALESDSDRFLADGLALASPARVLVDNLAQTRASATRVAATLRSDELERWVARKAAALGADGLARLRADVESLAGLLDDDAVAHASSLLSQAQGTSPAPAGSALAGFGHGAVDPRRVELFDVLASHLASQAPQVRPARDGEIDSALPTFEAYFSNFIEGTEFEIDEAVAIMRDGQVPAARPKDAHDVLGTFRLVSDPQLRVQVPADADGFAVMLAAWHTIQMAQRPEIRPGQFKEQPNRVGALSFVHPDATLGTLQAGWERIAALVDPFARAVLTMFVVSEVHPFDDGNGRVARAAANAQLSAAEQGRLVFPTVLRSTYLSALRQLSIGGRPDAVVAVCDYAQRWTRSIDWSTVESAKADLEATNALMTSEQADEAGIRLKLGG